MATAEEDGESTEVQQPANGGAQPGGGASKALEKLKENLEECVDKQSKLKSAEDSPRLRSLMASEYGLTGRIVLARVVEANCNDSEAKERIRGIISDSDDESGILSLLVRWIDDAHADQKYSAIIRMLSALRVLPISIEHLSATNAGSTINKLRKADDVGPDIQQMAGDVVKRWRAIAKEQTSSSKDNDNTNDARRSTSPNGASTSATTTSIRSSSLSNKQKPQSQLQQQQEEQVHHTGVNDKDAISSGTTIMSGDDADLFGGENKRKASTPPSISDANARKRQQQLPQAQAPSTSSQGSNVNHESKVPSASDANVSTQRETRAEHDSSTRADDDGATTSQGERKGILRRGSKLSGKKIAKDGSINARVSFLPRSQLYTVHTFVRLGDEGRTPMEKHGQEQEQQQQHYQPHHQTESQSSAVDVPIKPKKGSISKGKHSSSSTSSKKSSSSRKQQRYVTPEKLEIDPDWEVRAGEASKEKLNQEKRQSEKGIKRIIRATAVSPAEPEDADATVASGEVPVIPAVSLGPPPAQTTETSQPTQQPQWLQYPQQQGLSQPNLMKQPQPQPQVQPQQTAGGPPGFNTAGSHNDVTAMLASLMNATNSAGSLRAPQQKHQAQMHEQQQGQSTSLPPGFAAAYPQQGNTSWWQR